MGKGFQEEVTFGCDRVWAGGVVGAGKGTRRSREGYSGGEVSGRDREL